MDLNETLRWLDAGLPEDIARLAQAGFYNEAIARIDARLAEDWEACGNRPAYQGLPETGLILPENPAKQAPAAQAAGMIAWREILRRLPAEYPYTEQQAVELARGQIPDFTVAEFRALVAENRVDWRFVNGEKHYAERFCATLLDTDAGFAARAGQPHSGEKGRLRDHAIAVMRDKGQMSARISLQLTACASDAAFAAALAQAKAEGKQTVTARVWLPLPAACPSQGEIELTAFSHTPTHIAPETAPQRTVYWELELRENTAFSVDFSYIQCARLHDPMARTPEKYQPQEYLGEQAPHIVFTPYLRALTAQLTAGTDNPAEKAKRIYDFITLNVHYRYMPAYFVLDAIADNCVRSRRGDCGVMALAFITMCRIAGIPARWESGLSVLPGEAGCHDWARFYIAPMGWMYADCSFGSAAARDGCEARRLHYFGSLDPYRMVANSAFQAQLTPPKHSWRQDPYDNQAGEIELEGVGLYGSDLETGRSVTAFEEL